MIQGVDRDDQVRPGSRGAQPPGAVSTGGPSRLAGVKRTRPRPAAPGPARFRWLLGSGRAQPWPTACPCWSVTVTHQVVFGFRAAAVARSRVSQGSTGPSPDSSPGRSARRVTVASGTVRVTRLANPPAAPPPAQRRGGARAGRRPGGLRVLGAGPGVLAEQQVQVGAGAQLVHAAVQPGLLQLPGPGGDPLVRRQHLIRGQLPAHQRGVAGVLGPPLHPGELRRRLPPLPRLPGAASITARAIAARSQPGVSRPARSRTLASTARASSGRTGTGWPDDQLGLAPADDPVPQRGQRAGQPGGQVPGHGQQPSAAARDSPSAMASWSPVNSCTTCGHLPGFGFEAVLGVAPEHLGDRDELAGGGVRLDPVPRAHQPDQLMIGHPAQRVTRPAAVHRGVGGHRQLGAARRHVQRHPGPEPGRPATTRRGRPAPSRAGPGRAARAGRLHREQLIGGRSRRSRRAPPRSARRLSDSPGKTRAEPAWPGPRLPVLAASRAIISSAAASRIPASSSAVSSSCPGGGAHDSGSQYSCGASDGSSSWAHSRSSHASRSAAVIGSRSSPAGSPSHPEGS